MKKQRTVGITTHNMSRKSEYIVWTNMKQRCMNKNSLAYKNYGGRGITVCERWMKFKNFFEDMGDRPVGLQIDRKDNNGNYCKENCRWATRTIQNTNKRDIRMIEFCGRSLCIDHWAKELNINKRTLRSRFNCGWSTKDALTKVLQK